MEIKTVPTSPSLNSRMIPHFNLVPILMNTQDCSSKTIDEFKNWSKSNSLPINDAKCKEIIILKKGRL